MVSVINIIIGYIAVFLVIIVSLYFFDKRFSKDINKKINKWMKKQKKKQKKKTEAEFITSSSLFGRFHLGNLIGGFVVLLIGTSLIPAISKEINTAVNISNVSNVSNMSTKVIELVPGFFGVAILGIAFLIVFSGLRSNSII